MEMKNYSKISGNEVFGAPDSVDPPPPEKTSHSTASASYFAHHGKFIVWFIKFILVAALVSVLLAIPIAILRDIENFPEGATEEELRDRLSRLYVYNVFIFLLISWLGIAFFFLLGTALPYVFRLVARYVNPAHARYWRIVRVLRRPLCWLGSVFVSFLAFEICVATNLSITIAGGGDQLSNTGVAFIADFLEQGCLWALFYFLEKIIIIYTTIHYHFRSDLGRISKTKDLQNALMALYEASVYLYPVGCPEFADEDVMIGNATGAEHGEHRVRATRYLAKLGIDSYALTSFFGNFLSADPKSHWLRPASTYATVERAAANPKSAAALARRIWMSMVPMGKDSLKSSDIAEVLGPFRKEEAQKYFTALDQNEMGDIRLDEMEWTVTEAGKIRNTIYRGMQNADHCINTLDWILLLFIGVIMVFFIMVEWIPTLKDVQDTLKFFSLGLAFAIGRSVHHFLAGVVFILFDHPYDIGDRIELWSGQNNQSVGLFVERQSLLYTVFRRVDNWMELQVGNEFLQQCRIENVTRSGSNRQAVTMMVDIRTSFKDLTLLKTELEAFLKHPDNKRDFLPNLALAITAVHELNKLELRLVFTHRTNWSIEPLRAARAMKVMTALVAAVRKIRILRPDAGPLGQPGRPIFNVMLTEKEANERMERLREEATSARVDAGVGDHPPEAIIDVTNIQRGEDLEGDSEKVRMAVEEAAFMRRSEREAREAEEKKAMTALGKLPPLPHKGPPARQEAVSTGVEVAMGKRLTPHFRG
ncbi:hypothetical protein B0T16DRAFT_447842 [Cercophora newfieldiana]|uniref:Mechanosensitive ion channel protein Msy1/2-like transmembrane domain-containing protein n=1 Tax=Cercophora newfieldiana TaxID=92897 RepID=A0AA39Y150_9PEZI|nr:hypothetical protein B0T16DRAFT_447842 [Cercophora newfieldiana]